MASLAELRRRLGASLSDEELLLRATMPAGQVDAMRAAGPAARHYDPTSKPVMSLIRQLTARRDLGQVSVERQGFKLTLRRVSGGGRGSGFVSADSVSSAAVTVDSSSQALEALPAIKGFMFDLDGTLLLSDRSLGGYELLPGAVEVLNEAQAARQTPYVVLTNGSNYPPPEQAEKLRKLGLPGVG